MLDISNDKLTIQITAVVFVELEWVKAEALA